MLSVEGSGLRTRMMEALGVFSEGDKAQAIRKRLGGPVARRLWQRLDSPVLRKLFLGRYTP